jgi:class 3 adenylate cyclase/tetratricopeptide (TPR) repeat protein
MNDESAITSTPADNPEAYISGDRRRALAAGHAMPDRVTGSALFADISGFTALTESLAGELGGQRGAEELTAVLEVVFSAVLGELLQRGGAVIYFSGDAVTCWLDDDDGTRAVACALDMQRAMARVATVHTPGGATATLAMKVAVAAGPARRFVVGDPQVQLIDVLAGALMDRLAAAEQQAAPGDVVVDAVTLAAIGDRLVLHPARPGRGDAGVVVGLQTPVSRAPSLPPAPRLPESVVRQWLLPAVYERMRGGNGEFLAELRPAVPLFLRFGGIDYDADEDAGERLDAFVRDAQHVVDGWGGNVLQLTVGDKGAYLYSVFGSPIAHEDDVARACAAALELRHLGAGQSVTGIAIGIARGRLRSGTYGHRQRRTFCCLGDAVNLAARLMSKSAPGEILVTADVAAAAGRAFVVDELPDLTVKGKAAPISVRRLTGRTSLGWERRMAGTGGRNQRLLGRDDEVGQLITLARRAAAGRGQVAGVVAEAGMGKSLLVATATQQWSDEGTAVHIGEAASVGTATSYLAWRPIWAGLLGLPADDAPTASQIEAAIARLDPSLVRRAPLLGTVFGVPIEDSALTATFDAALRKSSLESLLLRCLELCALRAPAVIVIEDGHWLDPLSRDLLEVVCRSLARLPVFLVVTHRPGSFAVPDLPQSTVLGLARLDAVSCRVLIESRLGELYDRQTSVSDAVVTRLIERADGNPFHLGELVNYLHAEGVDPADDDQVAGLDVPTSLAALVLSRIDLLTEGPRRTLKVASVVGREFKGRTLVSAYPPLGDVTVVRHQLHALHDADLVMAEVAQDDMWAFRHASVHEVAYESLPFALRRSLHVAVGQWYEAAEPDALDLLAHHYSRGDDIDRKRKYLVRAGEAAQSRFANSAAVDYLREVEPMLDGGLRVDVLGRLGTVLELIGDRVAALEVHNKAVGLADSANDAVRAGASRAALAECLRKLGRFEDAAAQLDAARDLLASTGDRAGLARVGHLRGTLAAQTGDYATARREYTASLAVRKDLGDVAGMAALVSNMAIVAGYQNRLDEAQQLNEQALELRLQVDNPQAIAVSLNNLGMIALLRHDYAEAVVRCTEARRITDQVGDTWLAAIADNNLGNASRQLGDLAAARDHYADALNAYTTLGDPWALAIVYDDIAIMAARAGDAWSAVVLATAAAGLHETLGTPRVASAAADVKAAVSQARVALGADGAEAESVGGLLDSASTHDLAAAICGI